MKLYETRRFCHRGHDKMLPHGYYIKLRKDRHGQQRVAHICGVCARIKRNLRWKLKRT